MKKALGILFIFYWAAIVLPPVWHWIFPEDRGTVSLGQILIAALLAPVWSRIGSAIGEELGKLHKTKNKSMGRGWDWLVGRIQTDRDAAAVLDELATGWYAIAGIKTIAVVVLAFMGIRLAGVSDVVLLALAGYLLPRTRSRVLGGLLLLWAIGSAGMTVATRLGLMVGGRNVILAVFGLALGFRGAQATIVYHSRTGSVPVWKNVAIVVAMLCGAALIVFVCGLIVGAVVQALIGWEMPGDIVGAMVYMALLVVHLRTRRRFPWVVRPEPAMGETAV